jgi:hypothetical protein
MKNCCLDEQAAAAETIRKLQKQKKCEGSQQHELMYRVLFKGTMTQLEGVMTQG